MKPPSFDRSPKRKRLGLIRILATTNPYEEGSTAVPPDDEEIRRQREVGMRVGGEWAARKRGLK